MGLFAGVAVGENPLGRFMPLSFRTLARPVFVEKVAVDPRLEGGTEGARIGVLGVGVGCAVAVAVGKTLTCACWRLCKDKKIFPINTCLNTLAFNRQ